MKTLWTHHSGPLRPLHCTTRRLQTFALRSLSLSSVTGALNPPLDERTLPEYFETQLLPSFADHPALICRAEKRNSYGGLNQRHEGQHLRWTFGELDGHVEALARGLRQMGVKKGDRVGVVMGNNSAYATLQWACARIGAILVTINPSYRANELISVLNLVGVSSLVISPRIRTSNYVEMLLSQVPSLGHARPGQDLKSPELPSLRRIMIFDDISDASHPANNELRAAIDFREVFSWERSLKEERTPSHKDDVINLQFTSGTTGSPKAVSLTHHNLLNNGLSIGRCMQIGPNNVVCLVLGNLAAWSHGACILYASPTFSPAHIVDALAAPYSPDEALTALHGVPTHFLGVLQEIERRSLDKSQFGGKLRTGIAAGSPVPIELMKKLKDKMGIEGLTNAYGMTETSPVSFQTITTDPVNKRVETVGRIQPHVRAKIIGTDGKVLPIDTPGELCVAGYLLQKGYWNDEEQTRRAMKRDDEGTLWMHTGDEAIMDSEGYLRIVSRIKDIIIRGGENLFPVQIENVLLTHPNIVEAAVIAVPDSHYGEVVGAWIVPHSGAKLSREDVRAVVTHSMNPQNAPAWVWFTGEKGMFEELPKTASGKVQKHILRDVSKSLANDGIGKTMGPKMTTSESQIPSYH